MDEAGERILLGNWNGPCGISLHKREWLHVESHFLLCQDYNFVPVLRVVILRDYSHLQWCPLGRSNYLE